MTQWEHYDFDGQWSVFISAWNKPDVQNIVVETIRHECAAGADWKPGEPLWKLSQGNYWNVKLKRLARAQVHKRGMESTFKKRIESTLGCAYYTKQEYLSKAIENFVVPEIEAECSPVQGTIDSFMLCGYPHVMAYIMNVVAKQIFPEETVWQTWDVDRPVILVPHMKIVFDLPSYYFYTRDEQPQYRAESIINRIAGYLSTM